MANVVELITTMLKREGLQYIFGIPGGGGTIDLLDATEKAGIRFVLTTHETAAAMMACVVVELTGIPGVVLTAIAPGVTNVANGVAYAYLERAPNSRVRTTSRSLRLSGAEGPPSAPKRSMPTR